MDVARQAPATSRPRRGWFRRNWLWLIPAMLLLLCLACAGGGWVALQVVIANKRSFEPYQMALKLLQEDAQVKAQLGEPIVDATRFPFFPIPSFPTINLESSQGPAHVNFDVKGSKDNALVSVQARMTDGKWDLILVAVTSESTRQRILVETKGNSDLDEAPRWKP